MAGVGETERYRSNGASFSCKIRESGGDLEYSIMIRADTDHTLENHQERDLKCSHLVHLYNGTLLGH